MTATPAQIREPPRPVTVWTTTVTAAFPPTKQTPTTTVFQPAKQIVTMPTPHRTPQRSRSVTEQTTTATLSSMRAPSMRSAGTTTQTATAGATPARWPSGAHNLPARSPSAAIAMTPRRPSAPSHSSDAMPRTGTATATTNLGPWTQLVGTTTPTATDSATWPRCSGHALHPAALSPTARTATIPLPWPTPTPGSQKSRGTASTTTATATTSAPTWTAMACPMPCLAATTAGRATSRPIWPTGSAAAG